MGAGKGYEADILLGEETDTLDPEGAVVGTAPIPTLQTLEAAMPAFRGNILQAPPAYSAVHIDGERAYERVRKGQDVQPKARPVTIDALELLSYDAGIAKIRVSCSKGTYIRSLARDLALACGSRGRLSALRRTHSGPFSIAEATKPEEFGPGTLRTLTPGYAKGLGLGVLRLKQDESRAFSNGLPLFRLETFTTLDGASPVAVFGPEDLPLGIVSRSGTAWKYACVLGSDE